MNAANDNKRLGIIQAQEVRRAVDSLLASPSPNKAVGKAASRWNDPSATPFERYAGMVLRDAGCSLLAELPPAKPIQLIPPSEGQLARLACPADLSHSQLHTLLTVENAINRLICIADAIEDAPLNAQSERQRLAISFLGVGYLRNGASYRSAQVELPSIGLTEQAPIGYFNEIDWRILDHVASIGRTVFQNSILPNMNQSVLGSFAPDGSDWDVRTRMASIIEKLELPLRTECLYDCDTQHSVVSVRFSTPASSAFPQHIPDNGLASLDRTGDNMQSAQLAYALRCTCLMGAACFGAGKHIEKAYVTADDPTGKRPLITCTFDRHSFVRTVLTAIDSGQLADASLRFDPDGIANLMDQPSLNYAHLGTGSAIEPPDDGMHQQRIDPYEDARMLNDEAVKVFHSKRICDIDAMRYHGIHGPTIDEAILDAHDSVIAAIARLENVVEELESASQPPDDDARSRPLYCDQPLSRAMISLLNDQLSVSDQAEAFLNQDDAVPPTDVEAPRYFRAPSALFHAHMGLSDLYEQLGDFAGAEIQADKCIHLAPSTARAHFRKADILAQQGRFEEAANVILSALPFTVSERDCSLLYYHLALILWNLGRKKDAAAVYVYTAFLEGDYAEKATKTIAGLRKREDRPVILFASPLAAAREMSRAGIPVAPSDTARSLVARAAVSLANSHAPRAAAPYAKALAHYLRDDRVIRAACRSIQQGTTRA